MSVLHDATILCNVRSYYSCIDLITCTYGGGEGSVLGREGVLKGGGGAVSFRPLHKLHWTESSTLFALIFPFLILLLVALS